MAPSRTSKQTHPGVLPQLQALESASADNPRGRNETGRGRHITGAATGERHGRGEILPAGTRQTGRHPLLKWDHRCAYCDTSGVPLNLDHIVPRARGGSDRAANRTLACVACNQAKGDWPLDEFLKDQPQRLAHIRAQAKASLRDAAALNATRWALWRALVATDMPVNAASGGRTKWNRTRCGLPKTHTLDALCVGRLGAVVRCPSRVLVASATGRGRYQRTGPDAYGFARLRRPRLKRVCGYQTGDLVRAVVPSGKKAGTHAGRVAVRANGYFNVRTRNGLVQGVHHRHCRLLQRADGYGYDWAGSGYGQPQSRVSTRKDEVTVMTE